MKENLTKLIAITGALLLTAGTLVATRQNNFIGARKDVVTDGLEQTAAQTHSLTLSPCVVPGFKGSAKCGTYEVFENRATKQGRKISLKVVVFPATGSQREPDPLVYLPGGPGQSASEEAPGIAEAFSKIHERRDLLFVDQRGTGGSHPLNCELFNPKEMQSYLGYFFPLEDVKKCREQLQSKADLTLYTTSIAMDDLDEVRAALGYEQLNLFGGSYGTRASLVYLRQHPKHVRTVTLQGVAPTDQFIPRDFPQSNERALQGILAECGADEACNKAFPNIRTEAKSVLERLLKGPVEVEVQTDESGSPSARTKVKLSRDLAAEAIRYMLYQPRAASRVPLVLHLAAQNNFAPIAEAALDYRRHLVATGSIGLYLSITCAEDLPWINAGEGERFGENTFLGDYRLRQQREACTLWPRGPVPGNFTEPTRASVPALILTGEWDPVTPPSNADAAAKHLSNSLHVVVPDGAHGLGGLEGVECILNLAASFVEKGTTKGLDTACVKNVRRRGFALTLQ